MCRCSAKFVSEGVVGEATSAGRIGGNLASV